jgi:hypothetical protein
LFSLSSHLRQRNNDEHGEGSSRGYFIGPTNRGAYHQPREERKPSQVEFFGFVEAIE